MGKLNEKGHFALVMLNTAANFEMIIESWNKLTKFNFLTLYFVNPFSKLDKRWMVKPYVHQKICDDTSLKTGLKSMFDMVDNLSESDIKVKFQE